MLQVLAVVGKSASMQADTHSHGIAVATLGALAAAWLSAGRPLAELTAAVVAAAPNMPQARRVALLAALLPALPKACAPSS